MAVFQCTFAFLKILYFNSNSLYGKIDLVKAYCHTYKPNILAITKTNLSDDFDDNELLGANYTILQNDRKKGGGGVLFAVDNSLGEICITNQR